MLSVIASGVYLSSCSDDDKYQPGAFPDGPQVFIPADESAQIILTPDQSDYTIAFYRAQAGAALTVPVTVDFESDDVEATASTKSRGESIFSFPSSLTFEQDSKEAPYVFTVDMSQVEYGDEFTFTISIADEYSTPYGIASQTYTVTLPEPYKSLGMGTYQDYFWGVTEDDSPIQVEFFQNEINKNKFRITNPYVLWTDIEDSYFEFELLQLGDKIFGQEITIPGLVYYDTFYALDYSGWTGEDVHVYFPGYFNAGAEESKWVHNYVVDYQENGLPGEIHLSPFYVTSEGYGSNQSDTEPIEILFPGYEQLETTVEVTYEGLLSTTAGLSVQSVIELGADVDSARVGIYKGLNESDAVNAISDSIPSIEYMIVTQSGTVRNAFDENSESGNYMVVAVSYANGSARQYSTSPFSYGETWTSKGEVAYTDGFIVSWWGMELEDVLTYNVEIEECDQTPGYYRLVDPYGAAYPYNEEGDYDPDVTSYLYIHAENPDQVYVAKSPSTMNWGYGDLTFSSMAYYYMENGFTLEDDLETLSGYLGSLEDDVITMPFRSLMVYDEDGLYYANYVIDWDTYDESDNTFDYVQNEDGSYYAPFKVDLNGPVDDEAGEAAKASLKKASRSWKAKISSFGKINQNNRRSNSKIIDKSFKGEKIATAIDINFRDK